MPHFSLGFMRMDGTSLGDSCFRNMVYCRHWLQYVMKTLSEDKVSFSN